MLLARCAQESPDWQNKCDMISSTLEINDPYLAANAPIVKQRLQKAAVRLARLLDTALN
jgi:hypothetical protein